MGAHDYPSLGQQRADALVRITTEPDPGRANELTRRTRR